MEERQMTSPSHGDMPSIGDYGLIGDGHTAGLVSKSGWIDWACLPRLDSASVFGRLLDPDAGHCVITPSVPTETSRRYLPGTLILETTFTTDTGTVRLTDCITMKAGGASNPHRQILRIVEGVEGTIPMLVQISPRFDFGAVRPWTRAISEGLWASLGAAVGLLIESNIALQADRHDLSATVDIAAGDRRHLSISFRKPELLDGLKSDPIATTEADRRLEETADWWHQWHTSHTEREPDDVVLSAMVLKALNNPPTGAIAAAATTSLPEASGGSRNWDYRFSWIRDSWLTLRALRQLGFHAEADGFARFVARSSAGSGDELQVMYGLGGERDLTERTLDDLDGFRHSRPVRIGNNAFRQHQLDIFGELLDVMWMSPDAAGVIDDDMWRFLVEVADRAAAEWDQPDRGIWEVRGERRHFTFSKAMCWVALDRALKLADRHGRDAPVERWQRTRAEIRRVVLEDAFSSEAGAFTQSIGETDLDAAVLLLPATGIVEYGDARMRSTVNALIESLDRDGLLLRYTSEDGLVGEEGSFLACTFWLVEVLAHQDRPTLAHEYFQRARSTANDLGLMSEEYDLSRRESLGNYPQAMTHLGHISAALAIEDLERRLERSPSEKA
jgi:GH15 family glucan-1,4-alpha-glucosidase